MIRDLIIIKDGLPLFSKNFASTFNSVNHTNAFSQSDNIVMISGFFTALNTFSDSFEDLGMISELKLSNNDLKLSFLRDSTIPNMIYLATYDEKSNSVDVQKMLKKISRTFLKKYSMNNIVNWTGEMNYFQSFDEILEFFIEFEEDELENLPIQEVTGSSDDINRNLPNADVSQLSENIEIVQMPEYCHQIPRISCSTHINPKYYLTGEISHKVFNSIDGNKNIGQISELLQVEYSQVYNICKNLIKLGFISLV